MIPEHSLESYFREAASWDADKLALIGRSARIAWFVAAGGWICAVASCAALVMLMPLKRVDPFLIRVDSHSGVVDVVPAFTGHARMSDVVTRYFLNHYVTVCERFNFSTAESDYQECGAFHGAQRNQAWYSLWNPANPKSPLNVHRDGSTVRAQVESISFFKRGNGLSDLAQVRYVKAERQGPGAAEHLTYWITTVQYAYTEPSKDVAVRRWNPLGFRVIDFTPEPEVVPETAAGSRPVSSGAASPQQN